MNLLSAAGLPHAHDVEVEMLLRRLDAWAARLGELTAEQLEAARHDFDRSEPSGGGEPQARMLLLCRGLWGEFGVRYNRRQIDPAAWNWADSRDQFIHGLLGPTRSGTCSSLPVLVVALGRRLGYPLRLVLSPGHAFVRWDGKGHDTESFRGRFNIEFSGDGMDVRDDDPYYVRPHPWPVSLVAEETARPADEREYLRSLTPSEELAYCLAQRGWTLEAVGLIGEAVRAFEHARRYAPNSRQYAYWTRRLRSKQFAAAADRAWTPAVAAAVPAAPRPPAPPPRVLHHPTPPSPARVTTPVPSLPPHVAALRRALPTLTHLHGSPIR